VFNFLLVAGGVYCEMINSRFHVNKIGVVYYTFHAVVNVISLLDWFPGAQLDTNYLLKFDYLQMSLFMSALITNIELWFLFWIALPSYLAIEYWRGLLHLEYEIWITPIGIHFMRAVVTAVLIAIFCYRNQLSKTLLNYRQYVSQQQLDSLNSLFMSQDEGIVIYKTKTEAKKPQTAVYKHL
jgi:hypothetical protein